MSKSNIIFRDSGTFKSGPLIPDIKSEWGTRPKKEIVDCVDKALESNARMIEAHCGKEFIEKAVKRLKKHRNKQ